WQTDICSSNQKKWNVSMFCKVWQSPPVVAVKSCRVSWKLYKLAESLSLPNLAAGNLMQQYLNDAKLLTMQR
ncbi:hypothetical protein M514_01116, partial [Trichuris suis]